MRRQDLYCDRSHDIGLFLFPVFHGEKVSRRERIIILTLLFLIWLFYATYKLWSFAIRMGWGILKVLLSVVFFPVTIIVLLIVGIIKLTVPVLVIVGICALVSAILGKRA